MSKWWMTEDSHKRVKNLIPIIMSENPMLSETQATFISEYIVGWGCCEKARPIHCVCEFASICPDHGIHHHGTHD